MHAVFTGVNWRDRKETANAFNNYFELPENERQQLVDTLDVVEADFLIRMISAALHFAILTGNREFNFNAIEDLNDRIGERALREIQG